MKNFEETIKIMEDTSKISVHLVGVTLRFSELPLGFNRKFLLSLL